MLPASVCIFHLCIKIAILPEDTRKIDRLFPILPKIKEKIITY